MSPGYHKVKPLDQEGFGWEPLSLALLNLSSAGDGISVKGKLPPPPSGCPKLGMMGPVLLASVCVGKGLPPLWQHSSSLHLLPYAPAFQHLVHAPKLSGGEGRMDIVPRAGKECSHSWRSPVSWFGVALLAATFPHCRRSQMLM